MDQEQNKPEGLDGEPVEDCAEDAWEENVDLDERKYNEVYACALRQLIEESKKEEGKARGEWLCALLLTLSRKTLAF